MEFCRKICENNAKWGTIKKTGWILMKGCKCMGIKKIEKMDYGFQNDQMMQNEQRWENWLNSDEKWETIWKSKIKR